MAPESTSRKQHTLARCGKYALKFGAIGGVCLGAIAFVHVLWDARHFLANGRSPVDDLRFVLLSFTIIAAFVGAVVGAIVGVGTGLLKRQAQGDAGAI